MKLARSRILLSLGIWLAFAPASQAEADDQSAQQIEKQASELEKHQEYEKASSLLKTAITIREKHFDQAGYKESGVKRGFTDLSIPHAMESWAYVQDLQNLGWDYDRIRDFDNGGKQFEKQYAINLKVFGDDNDKTLASLNQLAMHYQRAGKYAEAENKAKKAVTVLKKLNGPDDIQLVFYLNTLYHIYVDQDRDKEAEEVCKEQLAVAEKKYGKDCALVASILEGYYDVLSHMGKAAEAKAVKERAADIREKTHTHQEHKVRAKIIK